MQSQDYVDNISDSLVVKSLILKLRTDPNQKVAGDYILNITDVLKFYQNRHFTKAWSNKNQLTENSLALIEEVSMAEKEGLTPDDYHIETLISLQFALQQQSPDSKQIELYLDLLLTDAYLLYAKHLYSGKVCPDDLNQDWHVPCREINFDFCEFLEQAISQKSVNASLEYLKPQLNGYKQLKKALARYQSLKQEKLPDVVFSGSHKKDLQDKVRIQQRLITLGDLKEKDQNHPGNFAEALNSFKSRHGLKVNGVIDSSTLKALNTSITDRIITIESNLERWRWLPKDLGKSYIMVNIANFSLEVFDSSQLAYRSSVIIGTPYHATPAFTAHITHIILNPYWYVPRSIIENEILNRSDLSAYLKQNNFEILDNHKESVPIDSVYWGGINSANFTYTLRQKPGPDNALGMLKFVLPNPYSVFIHDTPNKKLFEEEIKSFSHGCIRLERPFELAAYLLEADSQWDLSSLRDAAKQKSPTRINLKSPIPVHVLYWTAWLDQNQQMQFREDIYQRDQVLIAALKMPP